MVCSSLILINETDSRPGVNRFRQKFFCQTGKVGGAPLLGAACASGLAPQDLRLRTCASGPPSLPVELSPRVPSHSAPTEWTNRSDRRQRSVRPCSFPPKRRFSPPAPARDFCTRQ